MKYNQSHHKKLLDIQPSLKREDLSYNDRLILTYLSNYNDSVYCQLNWNAKDKYLEIFDNLLKNKITGFQFCFLFTKEIKSNYRISRTLTSEVLDSLMIVNIHPKAEYFTTLIDDLEFTCDVFEGDVEPSFRSPGHIGTSELIQEMQIVYSDMQDFIKSEMVDTNLIITRIIFACIALTCYLTLFP